MTSKSTELFTKKRTRTDPSPIKLILTQCKMQHSRLVCCIKLCETMTNTPAYYANELIMKK